MQRRLALVCALMVITDMVMPCAWLFAVLGNALCQLAAGSYSSGARAPAPAPAAAPEAETETMETNEGGT